MHVTSSHRFQIYLCRTCAHINNILVVQKDGKAFENRFLCPLMAALYTSGSFTPYREYSSRKLIQLYPTTFWKICFMVFSPHSKD